MGKSLSTLGMASTSADGRCWDQLRCWGRALSPARGVTGTETSSQQLSAPATGAQVPAGGYMQALRAERITTLGQAAAIAAPAPTPVQIRPDPAVQSPSGGGSGK